MWMLNIIEDRHFLRLFQYLFHFSKVYTNGWSYEISHPLIKFIIVSLKRLILMCTKFKIKQYDISVVYNVSKDKSTLKKALWNSYDKSEEHPKL